MADLCQSLYCQTTLAHTSREDILDKTMRTEVWKHLSAITSGEISVCYKAGQQLKAGVQMWRGGHPHGPVLTILSLAGEAVWLSLATRERVVHPQSSVPALSTRVLSPSTA